VTRPLAPAAVTRCRHGRDSEPSRVVGTFVHGHQDGRRAKQKSAVHQGPLSDLVRTERPTPELGDVHLNGRKQPCVAGARHVRRRGGGGPPTMGSDWGASMKLSSTAVGATDGPSSPPSCETPAPCQASLITSAPRSAAPSLGRGRPCDDVRRRRGPSRSADAVALVPAEQQCDETLRGGRTQFDVDGTVTGHRF
jgi:hypothetical protein